MSKSTTIESVRSPKRGLTAKLDQYAMSEDDWAGLDAMTDEEVLAAARADPDAQPLEDRKPGSVGPGRRVARAKRIRWTLGMPQSEIANVFQIPLGTLRDWEQHRREPDQAARAYLEVIAVDPKAVRKALAPAKRKRTPRK